MNAGGLLYDVKEILSIFSSAHEKLRMKHCIAKSSLASTNLTRDVGDQNDLTISVLKVEKTQIQDVYITVYLTGYILF